MRWLKTLVTFLAGLLIIVLAAGYYQTWKVMTNPSQDVFIKGTLPNPAPNGPYKGVADGYLGSWKGKKFDAATATGINLFDNNGQTVEQYKFKTYTGKGLKDDKDVLKIDYNVPGNPFWLKFIVDEVVQTAPNTYLGKVHLQLLPGIVFTITYFHLSNGGPSL